MGPLIFIVATIGSYIYMKRIRSSRRADELNGSEWFIVGIFSLLSPILAGAFFYYGWRKTLPKKAKTANRISWVVLIIAILAYYFLFFQPKFDEISQETHQQSSEIRNAQVQEVLTNLAENGSEMADSIYTSSGSYDGVCTVLMTSSGAGFQVDCKDGINAYVAEYREGSLSVCTDSTGFIGAGNLSGDEIRCEG